MRMTMLLLTAATPRVCILGRGMHFEAALVSAFEVVGKCRPSIEKTALQKLLANLEGQAKRDIESILSEASKESEEADANIVVFTKTNCELESRQRALEAELKELQLNHEEELGRVVAEQLQSFEEELERIQIDKANCDTNWCRVACGFESDLKDKAAAIAREVDEQHLCLPPFWKPISDEEYTKNTGFVKVELHLGDWEFQRISEQFQRTVIPPLKAIYRIQNPGLYRAYLFHKFEMKRRLRTLKYRQSPEAELFHGTAKDNVPSICSQGFDWRLVPTNGKALGWGNYFAYDANISIPYCRGTPRFMFVALVLVGRMAPGNGALRAPPVAPDGNPYDSVGSEKAIVVTFDISHAYPEYLIQF